MKKIRNPPHPLQAGDDPCPEDLPPHLRERLERIVPHLIKLGMGCVHSAESEGDGGEETTVDCERRVGTCRSVCCSFRFALTESEVEEGRIRWERERPYFIAHAADGYCTHHDRETRRCTVWEHRPLRCRRFDCRRESTIWEDADRQVLRERTFDHLPGKRTISGKEPF